MKKLLLYILLFCYTVVTFKPVLPFMSDFVGHAFFYAHHMATVHYENGKYHVHYEVIKDVKEESTDKTPGPASKKDNSANEHFVTESRQTGFVIALPAIKYHTAEAPGISSIDLNNDYPPPRA